MNYDESAFHRAVRKERKNYVIEKIELCMCGHIGDCEFGRLWNEGK